MKIFIDTANLSEIKSAYSWGIVDGVTTNPSLIKIAVDALKKTEKDIDMETYIKKILETAGNGPVSLEVIGLTEEEMLDQARSLYNKFNPVANNVVIKIPINPVPKNVANYDGLKVTARLSKEEIPVNSTLIMSPEQALLAAKAGASYVSPFAGRIDDYLRLKKLGWKLVEAEPKEKEFTKTSYYPAEGIINDKGKIVHDSGIVSGVELVGKIVEIFGKYDFKTEVIAASIRNSRQVREMAQKRVHIATVPFSVLRRMMMHHETAEGIRKFLDDVVPEYKNLFKY